MEYQSMFDKKVPSNYTFPPLFAFSLHKAGSTMLHKMINEVCFEAQIPRLSIPDIMFEKGFLEKDWANDKALSEYISEGRVYFGFRNFPYFLSTMPSFRESYKSVLLVRDPRDALVSQYFSFGGKHLTHKVPTENAKEFFERINQTAHLQLEQYVLEYADHYAACMNSYAKNLNFENVLLRKYEDVFFDKFKFLKDIFNHWEVDLDYSILQKVAKDNDVRPKTEMQDQHIRKGTPGDHAEKLSSQTIEELNNRLRTAASAFGYEF